MSEDSESGADPGKSGRAKDCVIGRFPLDLGLKIYWMAGPQNLCREYNMGNIIRRPANPKRQGFTDYDEEEYLNYGRNNPFAMFSLVVFYLVIALSVYAFTCMKSYLTPTNMGIGLILLLITGRSAMG